jgi:hypothetical protein
MVRRGIAAGAGLIILLLLVFGLRSCLDSRKERAYKDYVRDAAALIGESDDESDAFFKLLSDPGTASDVDIENQLNTFGGQAESLLDRSTNLDHPDELNASQRDLVETFQLRRDGVAAIARQLPDAIASKGDRKQGTEKIAGSMQFFLASDVIYQSRFAVSLAEGLKKQDLSDQEEIPKSQFLPDTSWLQPATVAERVAKLGGGSAVSGDAAPGLHGNGLGTVTLGGQALTPGGSAVSVPASSGLKFSVQVANQGENTETDVKVSVTVGQGGDAIKLNKTLDSIARGETKSVEIPLTETPPTGQNVPITIEVAAVAGEKKTDNNKGTFSAIFTR